MLTGKDKFALAMKKRSDYPLSHRAKRDIGCEGGYAAPRRIATAGAVPAIRCLLATSRSEKVSFSAVSANQVFAAQKKRFDYPPRPKQKQTIKKMELIKTIRARVGTVRSRIFRTPRAFGGKFRVLPTSQSAAAARRCGCFGEPSFCCAKSGSIIRSRPKHKQTSFRMSVYVWWARVDSDHRS